MIKKTSDYENNEIEAPDAIESDCAMTDWIAEALCTHAEEEGREVIIRTFEESGVMTNNSGLVVQIDGVQYQLTVVS